MIIKVALHDITQNVMMILKIFIFSFSPYTIPFVSFVQTN